MTRRLENLDVLFADCLQFGPFRREATGEMELGSTQRTEIDSLFDLSAVERFGDIFDAV